MSENKHQPWDLAQMQALPLEAKIRMTQQRIRAWYEHWNGMVYTSISGGKDSTVLKHIIDGMYDDVPSVFVNTGLEYPEIQKFIKDMKAGKWDCFNPDIEIVRPEMRFNEVIKKYGYPVVSKSVSRTIHYARLNLSQGKENTIYIQQLKGEAMDRNGMKSLYNKKKWSYLLDAPFDMHNACCDVMKKKPVHDYEKQTNRVPIVGTLASESLNRYSNWIKNGCNAFDSKKPRSAPLSFWTEQDILHYIKKYNVPYCPVYGDIVVDDTGNEEALEGQVNIIDYLECWTDQDKLRTTGCDRTGCIFCMFGCHLEGEPNRFQRLKQTHPRQYEYCIGGGEMVDGKWQPSKEGLGLGKVLDYIGVKY